MADAIEALTAAWSLAYRAIGGGRTAAIPTADLLDGSASTFGAGLDEWRRWKAGVKAGAAAGDADAKRGVFGRAARALSGRGRGGEEDAASSAGGASEEGGRVKKASIFKRMGKSARELID
jgi:hypothetical protein